MSCGGQQTRAAPRAQGRGSGWAQGPGQGPRPRPGSRAGLAGARHLTIPGAFRRAWGLAQGDGGGLNPETTARPARAGRCPAEISPPTGHKTSLSDRALAATPAQACSPQLPATHVEVHSLAAGDLGGHQVGHERPGGEKLEREPPAGARGPAASCSPCRTRHRCPAGPAQRHPRCSCGHSALTAALSAGESPELAEVVTCSKPCSQGVEPL